MSLLRWVKAEGVVMLEGVTRDCRLYITSRGIESELAN